MINKNRFIRLGQNEVVIGKDDIDIFIIRDDGIYDNNGNKLNLNEIAKIYDNELSSLSFEFNQVKKVYIAGAITNEPNYVEKFANAEKKLKELGYFVINPVKAEGMPYKWYIDEGLKQLMTCSHIYMLDGWQKSKGACLERKYAKTVGLEILYEKEPSYLRGTKHEKKDR